MAPATLKRSLEINQDVGSLLSRSPRAFYTGYSKVLLGLSLTAPICVGAWSTLRRAWLGSFLLATVPGWDCSSAILAT